MSKETSVDSVTFYKAVRPDGTDFHTGTVQWAPPEWHEGLWEVRHPTSTRIVSDGDRVDYSSCLCLSDAPADCTGLKWPARLLLVEAPNAVHDHSHKWVTLTATVVGERPAHEVFGPMGEHVAAFLDQFAHLTQQRADAMRAAWVAARDAAWVAARDAARVTTRFAAWDAAWDAARVAAIALVVRDVLVTTPEGTKHYLTLTRAARAAGLTVHPDDNTLDGVA